MKKIKISPLLLEKMPVSFQTIVINHIQELYNPFFLISYKQYTYSCFFRNDNITILKLKNNLVHDILIRKYDSFLTNEFFIYMVLNYQIPLLENNLFRRTNSELNSLIKNDLLLNLINFQNNKLIWKTYSLNIQITVEQTKKFFGFLAG